jgi:hypothetical protein
MAEMQETIPTPVQKPSRATRFLKRLFLALFVLILLLAASGAILAWKYQDEAKAYVIAKLNEQLNTQVIVLPKDIDFSVLRNFPNASVDFKNVKVLDATPTDAPKDTLFRAGTISLQFNIRDIFNKKYVIKRVSLKNVDVNLWVNKAGQDNFHFLKASVDTSKGPRDTSAFALDKIVLSNINVKYKNAKTKDNFAFTLKAVTLKGLFSSNDYTLKTELTMYVDHIRSKNVAYIQNRNIALSTELDVKGHKYTIRRAELSLGKLNLAVNGTIDHEEKEDIFHLDIGGKNMDIQSALSWLPGKYKPDIEEFNSNGNFYFHTAINGSLNKKSLPVINASFGVSKGEVKQTKANLTMRNVELQGEYSNSGKGWLDITEFSGDLPQGSLKGNFKLENFSNPMLSAKAEGTMNLNELQKFLRIDTIESLSGRLKINANFDGHILKTSEGLVNEDKTGGELSFSDVSLKLKNNNLRFNSMSGTLALSNSNVDISAFSGKVSGSDFSLEGSFKNMMAWLLLKDQPLTAVVSLRAKKIDLNDLLNDKTTTPSKNDPSYKLSFSKYLDLTLNTDIAEVVFRKFQASDIKGQLHLRNKRMAADQLVFNTMDGTIHATGDLDASRSDSVMVHMDADLQNVNIAKVFTEMENFGQQTLTDKNIKGVLSAKVQLALPCGTDLNINMAKLLAKCDVNIVKGELIKLASLKSLSKFISLNELEDIRFETLNTSITIANRVINIPNTQINSNAIDIEVSGVQDFDGNVDYVFGLYLSELLAKKAKASKHENTDFGEEDTEGKHRLRLYISMKGPIANPKIAYDHKAAQEERKAKRKEEKENLKEILNEEFGFFKKDSLARRQKTKDKNAANSKFSVKFEEDEKKKEEKKEEGDF